MTLRTKWKKMQAIIYLKCHISSYTTYITHILDTFTIGSLKQDI